MTAYEHAVRRGFEDLALLLRAARERSGHDGRDGRGGRGGPGTR
ncbi:hypothetical protein WDV06_16950 [Streptomyces racemochromogenes]|uniref:Uncharacterized protein n=1 Tax=Streptomyces racemochromogenes TaxID=67353 RepID=A0ABW7PEG6_9ACTN